MISVVDNNNGQQWTTIRGATCISDAGLSINMAIAIVIRNYCENPFLLPLPRPLYLSEVLNLTNVTATLAMSPQHMCAIKKGSRC